MRSAIPVPSSADRRALLLTKIALLVILVGIPLGGRRATSWPLAGWTMFSQLRPAVPAGTVAAEELRVTCAAGRVHHLSARDLWNVERSPVAARAMRLAFEHPDPAARAAHRAYLGHLVRTALPRTEIAAVERWRLVWRVDPLASPPLDRGRPLEAVRMGRLTAAELAPTAR